jgi:hypothetical protein
MKRAPLRLAALALGGFLLTVALSAKVSADGVTVYVNRSVVAGPGDLSLGDLVHASGGLSSAQKEALAKSVAIVSDRMLFIPVSAYLSQLDALFGADVIIVGSRSLVIPKGLVPDAETSLLDRLADALQTQGLFPIGITEIALIQNSPRASIPQDGAPTLQIQTTMKGTTEAAFSLSGTAGKVSFVSIRNDAGSSVRQGAPVQVLFHKGLITIEMPGKALAAAQAGEMVSVFVTDSQKTFTGQVVDGKAVNVDLP